MTQILLAEDDRISRIMLQAVLQKWGYRVVSVSDGEQALEKLLDPAGPSLAILDWLMPGISGVEVCQRIRAEVGIRPIHLMLLTSKGKGAETAESLAAGADDHLSKPYNLTELQARIELGLRRLSGNSTGRSAHDSGTGAGSKSDVDAVEKNCTRNFLPLNRLALGVVMDHPDLLSEPSVRPGTCDMDIEVQTLLLRARAAMEGRVECVWEGAPLMIEASSESFGQILLNLLVFFREIGAPSNPCRIRMTNRREANLAVLDWETDQPEISQVALDRYYGMPSDGSVVGLQGFGPFFAKLAVEAVGGSLRMVSRPYGGVAVQIRLPLSD
jgi:DNA-binding response OmpR family regulator